LTAERGVNLKRRRAQAPAGLMEREGDIVSEPEERTVPAYSFSRIVTVILFGQAVGLVGAAFFFLIMFAPCGIPWAVCEGLFGKTGAILVVYSIGGGFTSGCFIKLHLRNAPWRFLILFVGNPSFLLFCVAAASVQMNRSCEVFGITLDYAGLSLSTLFVLLGTLSAAVGDRYTWRRAKHTGVRLTK
jgi:hypothetical protein